MSTAFRITSTTPLQALWLLNDPFVHEQAKKFALRLDKERPSATARIERAYLLALGQPPTPEEEKAAASFVEEMKGTLDEKQAWESFARVIFRLNEFVYLR